MHSNLQSYKLDSLSIPCNFQICNNFLTFLYIDIQLDFIIVNFRKLKR